MNYNLRYLPFIVVVWLVCAVLFSCANMSRPTGGPKDETPPVYIKSNPLPNECNFNNKRIEIEFDEIVQVDKPSEKVIISPPQLSMPKIQAQGRKVRVELQDSLLPNTTYTIDFGDAIVDNNEKNALQGFSISFSTGAERDSLQVSGILLNAADLEPITGMMVGLYSNLDDSAFTTLPLERVTTSDARGHFVIRNLKPIPYRIVKRILIGTTSGGIHSRVICASCNTIHLQHLRQILHLLASQTIYNTRLAFHRADITNQILIYLRGLRTYFVI